jgi:hypothetical protein
MGHGERQHDMNHFMARLIFCFFAEDTDIFKGTGLFTDTIAQMSTSDSSNTHEVIGELFRAMNTKIEDRGSARISRWADRFPYVNGGLFSGNMDVPRFSRSARSYLLHIGNLDWTKINPDIFGSMIQAVAEDEERGALGMHYTSVPNILKVLNPLFLDDLRAKLEDAGDNPRKLLNLRDRDGRARRQRTDHRSRGSGALARRTSQEPLVRPQRFFRTQARRAEYLGQRQNQAGNREAAHAQPAFV